jgi:hypothetical protein
MPGNTYFLPARDADFDAFFHNFCRQATQNTAGQSTAWTNIPAEEVTALNAAYDAWRPAYEAVLAPPTPGVTAAKKEARDAGEKALSDFKHRFIDRNPQVTPQQLTDLGLHERRPPSPHPKPEGIPDVEILTPHPRVIHIRFRAVNAPRWGKPENVHGLECLWVIADTPPAVIGDLLHSAFATKNPLELAFDENQRGRKLYFAVRWETGAVLKGDWSDIFSAIIP